MESGVLTDKDIKELIERNWIISTGSINEKQIQANTLDLTLGHKAYKLRSSFLPKKGEKIEDIISKIASYDFRLNDKEGRVLEVGITYLIELREILKLPLKNTKIYSSTRSSIGRLDVLVRLVTDDNTMFDETPEEFDGKMYLQVTPLSFPIRVKEGDSLNQIRFILENPLLNKEQMLSLNREQLSKGRALLYNKYGNPIIEPNFYNCGIILTADLSEGSIVYISKKNTCEIDLSKDDYYDPEDFFEIKKITKKNAGNIIFNPGEFALVATKEFVSIPSQEVCAEMVAIDLSIGSYRSHYAGFFDSGFGFRDKIQKEDGAQKELILEGYMGNQATLEIRAFDVSFRMADNQDICKLEFNYTLSEVLKPYGEKRGSNYPFQKGPKLSKFFKT